MNLDMKTWNEMQNYFEYIKLSNYTTVHKIHMSSSSYTTLLQILEKNLPWVTVTKAVF